ncbi:nuclear transport factor 2 family protein [Maricaulis sp. CAU 1757]
MQKEIDRILFERETALHKFEVRSSAQEINKYLSDSFIEFGSSGTVFTKASIIEALAEEEEDLSVKVENFETRILCDDTVLVTYKSTITVDGQVLSSLRSSIWMLEGDEWMMAFHQGTRAL